MVKDLKDVILMDLLIIVTIFTQLMREFPY